MCATREQAAFHKGKRPFRAKRMVFCDGGFGSRLTFGLHINTIFDGIFKEVVFQSTGRRIRSPVNGAEIVFFNFTKLDFFVDDPESFRIFGSDDDPSGIAVNTVAESRSEGVFLTGMPLAFLSKVSLNVSNKSIIVPLTCTVTKHTRFFICQKDILILIDDGYTGFTYFQIGVFLSRLFKEFIVNVELYTISL